MDFDFYFLFITQMGLLYLILFGLVIGLIILLLKSN